MKIHFNLCGFPLQNPKPLSKCEGNSKLITAKRISAKCQPSIPKKFQGHLKEDLIVPRKVNGHDKEMWFGVPDRIVEQTQIFNGKQQQQQKNQIKKATVDSNL